MKTQLESLPFEIGSAGKTFYTLPPFRLPFEVVLQSLKNFSLFVYSFARSAIPSFDKWSPKHALMLGLPEPP